MNICPVCGGIGETFIKDRKSGDPWEWETCIACDGTGKAKDGS